MAASSSRMGLETLIRPIASSSRASLASFRQASTLPATPETPSSPTPYLTFPPHTPLPRPHNIHTATLHLAAHHPYPLDLYTSFAIRSAASLGIPTSNPASLPSTRSLYTVLKSPFVHKKAQENFERRTHKRVIKVWDADRAVVDLWLRYLKRNGIGGVGMKAYVFEWADFGFGRTEVEGLAREMEGLKGDDIQKASRELVKELSGESVLKTAPTEASSGEEANPSEDRANRTEGPDLVEGSDDVVAGETLPEVKPEQEAEQHTASDRDGGSRGSI